MKIRQRVGDFHGIFPAMVERSELLARIRRALKRSRVVALIGPRQSGKTTLAREIGPTAQACAVSREPKFDPDKVNPNRSGISLGHPVGATGAIITTRALCELQRVGGRYALATMCIGGGHGISAIFERAYEPRGRLGSDR
jgi:hypothetical protein